MSELDFSGDGYWCRGVWVPNGEPYFVRDPKTGWLTPTERGKAFHRDFFGWEWEEDDEAE